MTDKVWEDATREHLMEDGDIVLAGVSGGADSVCLLLILLKLREKIGFHLSVVHVEHGIRGAESRADAAFVERLCEEKHVECRVFSEDIPRFAGDHGLGLEEAARIRRYACYKEAASDAAARFPGKTVKIALAHHADDNAETVLFQMVRGSGMDGLCGMPYKRKWGAFFLIRPLLGCTREQIEAYLAGGGQAYRTDATNGDTDYSRNRIRHKVLPELRQVNAQAVAHINQSAAFVREANDFLHEEIEKIYQRDVVDEGGCIQILEILWTDCAPFLRREVIRRALAAALGSKKDLTAAHVEAVQQLHFLQVGRRIALPDGLLARRSYTGVVLEKCTPEGVARENAPEGVARENARESAAPESAPEAALISAGVTEISREQLSQLADGGQLEVMLQDGGICFRVFPFLGEMEKIPKKTYTKWLNYDNIKGGLQIRTRAAGDYLTVDAAGHKKKLKEYFINEKVPEKERNRVLLLAEDSHILWVAGGRISADCRITAETKKVLEVRLFGGKYCESQEY